MELTSFSWVDWLLLAIFAVFLVRGWASGLIKQLVSLARFVVGLYLANKLAPHVGAWLNNTFGLVESIGEFLLPIFGSDELAPAVLAVISFLICWAVVSIFFELVSHLLSGVARLPVISTLNRLGGAALGALKGLLVVIIVTHLLMLVPETTELGQLVHRSALATRVYAASPVFYEQLMNLVMRILERQPG
ncbi:MAG: CvpA family protein [Bacillota bacterium]